MGNVCGLVGNVAGNLVQNGWTTYANYAKTAFHEAQDFAGQLKNYYDTIEPVNVDLQIDIPEVLLTDFEMPEAPDTPELEFNSPVLGYDPDIDTSLTYTFYDPPEYDVTKPSINTPQPPDALTATAPDTPPELSDVTVPDAPTIVLPDAPTPYAITLPDVPDDMVIPTWSETAPEIDFVAPTGSLVWSEDEYSSALLTKVTGTLSTWLDGGTGLPDEIWNQIWARVTKANAQLARRSEQEAAEEWASRGFFMPLGPLNAAIARVRQEAINLDAEKLREIALEAAKMEVENLRFAIDKGTALETVLIGAHQQMAARALEAEKLMFDVAINIFNSKVSLYNAQIQGYATKAQVYKTQIEASLLVLERYKAELEGQKLIGELNQQAVQLYLGKLDAVTKAIEVYKAQLEGVRTQVDVDKNRIESFRALIQAYGEQVQAKGLEYQAYQTQLQGELMKVQIYQSETNAFASRMNAFVAQTQAMSTYVDAQVKIKDFEIKKFDAYLEKFKAEIAAESERIKALSTQYDGQAKVYVARGEIEKARTSVEDRRFELYVKQAQITADLEAKEAELNLSQIQRLLALELESLKTILATQSQLASAAMAAFNLQASVQESAQNSSQCQESYSY